ncbi:MAG: hypothetical protein FJ104_11060, partial [Deltaproteobacteria bacterium]|nr:hypothetical protein [Deltaproteobacteria bacterium]
MDSLTGASFARAALAAAVVAGCAGDPEPEPCPRAEATFRIEVTAADEPLTAGTRILVEYQGNLSEEFVVGEDTAGSNIDVCCATRPQARSGALAAVSCGG